MGHMRIPRHIGHPMYLKIEGDSIIYNVVAGMIGELEVNCNLDWFGKGSYPVLKMV